VTVGDFSPIDEAYSYFLVANQPQTGFVCDHKGTYRNSPQCRPPIVSARVASRL